MRVSRDTENRIIWVFTMLQKTWFVVLINLMVLTILIYAFMTGRWLLFATALIMNIIDIARLVLRRLKERSARR